MRIAVFTGLAIATILTAAPALAQAYDPKYPVCLHAYGHRAGYIDCSYTSLAQCAQSAAGRAAQCSTNPFFANANAYAGPRDRRLRGGY